MNMKKTIAAVAASAVAVSAMATNVSAAFGEQTLHYNLVRTDFKSTNGSVTISYRIEDIGAFDATNSVIFLLDETNSIRGAAWDVKEITIRGTSDVSGKVFTEKYVVGNWNESYSRAFASTLGDAADGYYPDATVFDVSDVVTLRSNTELYIEWVVPHQVADINAINSAIRDGDLTVGLTVADVYYDGTWINGEQSSPSSPKVSDGSTGTVFAPTAAQKFQPKATAFVAKGNKQYPFKTQMNGGTEILRYLGTDANRLVNPDKDTALAYKNIIPVLNDAIANYDDITFTFNTATKFVGTAGDGLDQYFDNEWDNDSNVTDKYKSFGDQIYNLYAGETSGYTGYITDYQFYNLFNGALVINGIYSMSLSDVNAFTYGAGTLSFNWEDVMTTNSGSAINPYVSYLSTMNLYTSADWYWDSLDVVLANTVDETVNTTAPVEGEDDIIEDEEIIEEEEVIEEEVIEEEEEDVIDVVEETPVENVPTGNASVALAVIPVALAAAAIIAKKRG